MRCKRPVATLATALLPLAALSACATQAGDEYPSLAIRDVERISGSADPAPREVEPAPPTPAAVLDRLAQLRTTATQAHATFTTRAKATSRTISTAAGAAQGSEAWAAATAALADLDGARSETMVALADLDRLFVDAATQGADLSRIGATRDEVEALIAQENATIDRLTSGS